MTLLRRLEHVRRTARTRERTTLALVLFFSATTLASADGNTGLIYGKVVVKGSRAPRCPIVVTAESDREPDLHTRTWTDGTFTFLSVMPGRVKLVVGRARSTGYVTVSANLETHAGIFTIPRDECAQRLRPRGADTSAAPRIFRHDRNPGR